jgi:hypothetical protein
VFACSFEESAEDFPVLGADVLGSPAHDGEVEDCIAIEATYSSPDAPVVSDLNEDIVVYSDEEQQIPASYFDDSGSSQPVYDSYESDSEMNMKDFQEHATEPFPLYIEGKHCVEIIHPGPAEDQEKSFPMGLVYEDYDSDPWESHEEEEGEPNEQFISCPEPVSEKPSPGISQPASTIHSPAFQRHSTMCEQL